MLAGNEPFFSALVGTQTYRHIKDVLSPSLPTDVSFTEICTKMTAHLQPKPSKIVQRFRFNTKVCQPHETVATYVTQLKRLAQHCNFGGGTDRLNEMIRDRLVCGVANEKWQQRLLVEESLTYDKAYKLLLGLEASQVKDLTKPEATTAVHQIRPQSSTPHSLRKGHTPSKQDKRRSKTCHRCGGEHNQSTCRFKEAECRYCHNRGHIAAVCRRKKKAIHHRAI